MARDGFRVTPQLRSPRAPKPAGLQGLQGLQGCSGEGLFTLRLGVLFYSRV